MFVGEFPTMDDPVVNEGFEWDYTIQNSSRSHPIIQTYSIEECLDLYGNYTNFPRDVECLEHAPVLTQSTLMKSLILSVMGILSFLGNVATILSIRKKRRHTSAHVYSLIYHLSIADLFVTFWCILGDAIWSLTVEWLAGNLECKIFKFFQMFSLYLSTFIMVLIGVDRFIAVKYPLKSMRRGLCLKLIGVCWVCSAVLSLPQMMIFHVKRGPFVEEFYQCVTYGFYTAHWQEALYTVFTLVFGFILPLVILTVTYLLTVVTLHRNEEILDHTGTFHTLIDPNRRRLLRRAKMKSLRISVAIVVTFLICWTPYYVMMITYLFLGDQPLNEDLEKIYAYFFFFGMSNSFFNPMIYGIFHIWTPRRKELQRDTSSRRTLLTALSFMRRRSSGALIVNGSVVNRNGHGHDGASTHGHTQIDDGHTQRGGGHHHHLHRNGTFASSKDSVKTMNSSLSRKNTGGSEEDGYPNRKNSLKPINENQVQNHNGTTPRCDSHTQHASDTHICICNQKGFTSSPNVGEHNV